MSLWYCDSCERHSDDAVVVCPDCRCYMRALSIVVPIPRAELEELVEWLEEASSSPVHPFDDTCDRQKVKQTAAKFRARYLKP